MPIQSINPATEEVLATFPELSADQLEEKLARAQLAFTAWKNSRLKERQSRLLRLAEVLRQDAQTWAEITSQEMGRPIKQSLASVEKCALTAEYYAAQGPKMLEPEVVVSEAQSTYVRFDPLGVIFAVMPWNFPLWQVLRFAIPAVMAGNVALLKHASNVPQSALAIETMFDRAGFSTGVFQTLLIGSNQVEALINDWRVKAVTLTGSEQAGKHVAGQAGRALKPTVLELGGSDPFIVLKDADLNQACQIGVKARLQNAGQSCIAAKRFILERGVADAFMKRFKDLYASAKVGDPMDETTEVGPLATKAILEELDEQVQHSVKLGAKVLLGGKRLPGPGYYYEPTILTDIKPGMPAYEEEFFGPVAIMMSAEDAQEAIRLANDTRFGLGASLWTQDLALAKRLIPQLEAGAVFVNAMVKSDPRLPFGGVKASGYGRELSDYGLKEFVNIKTVWIA